MSAQVPTGTFTVTNLNPLTATPPTEVPLKNAPLVRAIAQVRFPPILSIEQQEFVGSFQEAIRQKYPILQPVQTQGLLFNPLKVPWSRLHLKPFGAFGAQIGLGGSPWRVVPCRSRRLNTPVAVTS